jgi:hypothetical protein
MAKPILTSLMMERANAMSSDVVLNDANRKRYDANTKRYDAKSKR